MSEERTIRPKGFGKIARRAGGQVVAALGLTLTPIALGSAYQDVVKWGGLFESLVHYWDNKVRQPLLALLTVPFELFHLRLSPPAVDYFTLGILFVVSGLRAQSLTGRVNYLSTWDGSPSLAFKLLILGLCVLIWPFLAVGLALYFSLSLIPGLRDVDENETRKIDDVGPWPLFLVLCPFVIFIGLLGISPGGPTLLLSSGVPILVWSSVMAFCFFGAAPGRHTWICFVAAAAIAIAWFVFAR